MIRVDDNGGVWFRGNRYSWMIYRIYAYEDRYPDGTPHSQIKEPKTVEYKDFYNTYYNTDSKNEQ